MSGGTIRDRQVQSKEEFIEKGELSTAKKWCDQTRQILGEKVVGLVLPGNAKEMDDAITHISKDLGKLDKLAPYGAVQGTDNKGNRVAGIALKLEEYEARFKEIAWELELLRAEYRVLESQKKEAGFRSQREKNAKANMKAKVSQIVSKAEELKKLETEVRVSAAAEKQRQKEILDKIKAQPNGKEIVAIRAAFGKELVKLRKIADYFLRKYDAQAADGVNATFEQFAALNWLEITSVEAATEKKTEILARVAEYQNVQGRYKQGKKDYESALKAAQPLMEKGERLLPVGELCQTDRRGFMDRFAIGEKAYLDRDFLLAGKMVNATFVEELSGRVKEVENQFLGWESVKKGQYKFMKAQLENLTQREYGIIALSKVAEAVSLGDQKRDFQAALDYFGFAEAEAKKIINVDEKFSQRLENLDEACSRLIEQANAATGDARQFAQEYPDQIAAAREEFYAAMVSRPFANGRVPAESELVQEFQKATDQLAKIEADLNDLADQAKLTQRIQGLASNGDIRLLLEQLSKRLNAAKNSVSEYAALGVETDADSGSLATWTKTIDEAAKWLELRQPDLQPGAQVDYSAVAKTHAEHIARLDDVIADVSRKSVESLAAIDQARAALAAGVKKLRSELKIARFDTFRQATWHAEAKGEVQQMEALLKTNNLTALVEKKKRVDQLIAQCAIVIHRNYDQYEEWADSKIEYDDCKSRLTRLIKALKSKDVKKVLPRECEYYAGGAGVLIQNRTDLQVDGPGAGRAVLDRWKTKIQTLENEVKLKVLDRVKELLRRRKRCQEKIKSIKSRISGELCAAIQANTGGSVVLGTNLPIFAKVLEAEGNLVSVDTLERYDQLERQLANLDEEVTWAIEDCEAGDAGKFVEAHREAEEKQRRNLETAARLKAQYDIALAAFSETRNAVKGVAGLDKDEFKRYVDLYKSAKKAAKKATWEEAARKMDLAYRLMKMLQENPLASQTTGRGTEHLKELNIRWQAAIDRLNESIQALSSAIHKSCEQDREMDEAIKPDAISGLFDEKVVEPVKAAFDEAAFQRELLMLQGKVPGKADERRKDLDNKKKYREQALGKVRSYQRLLQKHPLYQTVMFQSNPWRTEGGTVNALDLMRAINDIDLNVQRSVG